MPTEPYGQNVTRLTTAYADFIILTGFEGFGWRARMIPPAGMPGNGKGYVGRELAASSLDELAVRMDAARAEVIRPSADLLAKVDGETGALLPPASERLA